MLNKGVLCLRALEKESASIKGRLYSVLCSRGGLLRIIERNNSTLAN